MIGAAVFDWRDARGVSILFSTMAGQNTAKEGDLARVTQSVDKWFPDGLGDRINGDVCDHGPRLIMVSHQPFRFLISSYRIEFQAVTGID